MVTTTDTWYRSRLCEVIVSIEVEEDVVQVTMPVGWCLDIFSPANLFDGGRGKGQLGGDSGCAEATAETFDQSLSMLAIDVCYVSFDRFPEFIGVS
jgi:hypothetical protein